MALLLTFGLVGCGGASKEDQSEDQSEKIEEVRSFITTKPIKFDKGGKEIGEEFYSFYFGKNVRGSVNLSRYDTYVPKQNADTATFTYSLAYEDGVIIKLDFENGETGELRVDSISDDSITITGEVPYEGFSFDNYEIKDETITEDDVRRDSRDTPAIRENPLPESTMAEAVKSYVETSWLHEKVAEIEDRWPNADSYRAKVTKVEKEDPNSESDSFTRVKFYGIIVVYDVYDRAIGSGTFEGTTYFDYFDGRVDRQMTSGYISKD